MRDDQPAAVEQVVAYKAVQELSDLFTEFGALALQLLERLGERDVVDSIRNPAEVEELRRLPHFVLLGVRASMENRFRRSLDRARPGDPATLEEFRSRERQENSDRPEDQQLDATFRLADRVMDNDGDLDALRAAVDRFLAVLAAKAEGGR